MPTLTGGMELKQVLHSINHRTGALYDFVTVYTSMANVSTLYRNGIQLTVVEAMVVVAIAENPGITAAQLCVKWKRSPGNISQLLKKIEAKGLIVKESKPDNHKEIALYTTDEGIRLYHHYMMNDAEDATNIAKKLLETCTMEELKGFYKVIDSYTKILIENREIQWGNNIQDRSGDRE